jgi:hypothetical protein
MEKSKVYDLESLVSSQFENCSRETLITLLAAYARLYLVLDGHWYLSVKQRFGDEQAVDIDLQVWDKQVRKEVEELVKLMDFRNRDAVSLVELSVIMPSAAGSKGYIEIKNRNDCTLNITHCPIVRTLEKEGKGREKTQCEVICRRVLTTMALSFNPSMEVKPIKLPPRQNQDEIYCQWQFKLEGTQ